MITLTDKNGLITYVSKNFEEILGYSNGELIGKHFSIIYHKSIDSEVIDSIWDILNTKRFWTGLLRHIKKDGTSLWVKTTLSAYYENDKFIGYKGERVDVTEEINLSSFDTLEINAHLKSNTFKYLAIIDIPTLKTLSSYFPTTKIINIKENIVSFLKHKNNKNLKCFKGIGDQFVIFINASNKKMAENELKILFSQIINFDISYLTRTISIYGGVTKNINEYSFIEAEIALSVAIQKNETIVFFDNNNAVFKEIRQRAKEQEITKKIVASKQLYPFFQPIINIKTGDIEKYEVLVRAKYKGKIIPPSRFIKHAEDLGLINEITKIILEKSFKIVSETGMPLSINITESDLRDKNFFQFVLNLYKKYKIDVNKITFEILENISFSDENDFIIKKINELQAYGFSLAIDDFGAENSNFSKLLDIHMDYIKIDSLFIKNINKNEKNKFIVKSIVSMANVLGIKTVAEYVENEDILKTIRECGIDYAQGYFIGEPKEDFILNL